jgi:hypothetical protein
VQRLLPFGLIAAIVLVTAACGANPVPSDDVADAGANTKVAGTARVETLSRISFGSAAETYEFRSTGVVDYANDRSEDREQASGCRTITIGEISYSELPPGERGPVGKRWVKSGGEAIDSEALFEQSHEQSADDAPGLGTSTIVLSGVDPTPDEYLDDLRESSGEPERVGEEDVRGVQTTRYRTKLDLRRMTRLELEEAGWQVANIERYLDGLVEGAREIDVWVDSDRLVRRIVANDTWGSAEEAAPDHNVTTTEFFDFGLDTDIQPPPAAEVMTPEDWERVLDDSQHATEIEMREWLDKFPSGADEGSQPLPGAFEPSTLLRGNPAQPASCLH